VYFGLDTSSIEHGQLLNSLTDILVGERRSSIPFNSIGHVGGPRPPSAAYRHHWPTRSGPRYQHSRWKFFSERALTEAELGQIFLVRHATYLSLSAVCVCARRARE
jgi:hypothetical protein